MPEGPSILYLKNKLQRFAGKIVSEASGYCTMDKSAIDHSKIEEIAAFGKTSFLFLKISL